LSQNSASGSKRRAKEDLPVKPGKSDKPGPPERPEEPEPIHSSLKSPFDRLQMQKVKQMHQENKQRLLYLISNFQSNVPETEMRIFAKKILASRAKKLSSIEI